MSRNSKVHRRALQMPCGPRLACVPCSWRGWWPQGGIRPSKVGARRTVRGGHHGSAALKLAPASGTLQMSVAGQLARTAPLRANALDFVSCQTTDQHKSRSEPSSSSSLLRNATDGTFPSETALLHHHKAASFLHLRYSTIEKSVPNGRGVHQFLGQNATDRRG